MDELTEAQIEAFLQPLGRPPVLRRERIERIELIGEPSCDADWEERVSKNIREGARYLVITESGEHQMKGVTKNPAALLFVDDKPATTCAQTYTPLTHHAVARRCLTTLHSMGHRVHDMEVRSLRRTDGDFFERESAPNQAVMTFKIAKGYTPPRLASFVADPQEERFDVGLTITNSYDFSMGIHALMHTMRLFCMNQLFGSGAEAFRASVYHTASGGDEESLLSRIPPAIWQTMEHQESFWRNLSDLALQPVDAPTLTGIFRRSTLRQYEGRYITEKHGVSFVDDALKLTVSSVGEVTTRWKAVNVLTDLANAVSTPRRAHDLRTHALRWVRA